MHVIGRRVLAQKTDVVRIFAWGDTTVMMLVQKDMSKTGRSRPASMSGSATCLHECVRRARDAELATSTARTTRSPRSLSRKHLSNEVHPMRGTTSRASASRRLLYPMGRRPQKYERLLFWTTLAGLGAPMCTVLECPFF